MFLGKLKTHALTYSISQEHSMIWKYQEKYLLKNKQGKLFCQTLAQLIV